MKKYITFSLLILSLVLISVGIISGQYQDVLNKAIRICMECVGIG